MPYNYVDITPRVSNIFHTGQTTVGTSATRLTSDTDKHGSFGIVIKADENNSGTVYIGRDENVSTSTGYPLGPGEGISLEIANPYFVWVIADTDNQKVYWVVV